VNGSQDGGIQSAACSALFTMHYRWPNSRFWNLIGVYRRSSAASHVFRVIPLRAPGFPDVNDPADLPEVRRLAVIDGADFASLLDRLGGIQTMSTSPRATERHGRISIALPMS